MFAFQSYAKIDLGTCVGMWIFDEGNGDIAKDSSGNGNDGKINGATWVDGKFNKALSFNGASNYVEVPDAANLNPKTGTNQITVMVYTMKDNFLPISYQTDNANVTTSYQFSFQEPSYFYETHC